MATCRSIRIAIHPPILIFFVFVFLIVLFSARVCTSYEMLIGTGKSDSFSYFAGKAICSSIKSNAKNLTCRPVPSEGYASSLTNLQSGSLDMALVSSKMIYDAFSGAGFFQYINIQYDNLRLLLPFYRAPICLIVRRDAGISSLNDLAGKRVNGGAPYSRQDQVIAELMAIKNWSKDNFLVYQNISSTNAQDSLALKSGSIQAMLHIGMHPDNSLRHLLVQNNSKLVGLNDADVNRLIDSKEGFSRCSIDAGMYPELTSDLDTLATETLLITSADTDNETVELILNALTKAKRQLQQAHPSFLQNNIGIETLNDSYLHPHPAAILFFQANLNRLQ
jgi:TRAP transporter TAXI family solute receptor